MDYYVKLIGNINSAIDNKEYSKAKELILDELKAPYVPSDIKAKLDEFLELLPKDELKFSLSDEEIEEYLFGNGQQQLVAVNALNTKNLRDYEDLCNRYLTSNGLKNAKALLIESLIKQEISDEFKYTDEGIDYNFIPRFVRLPEESDGFKEGVKLLESYYLKEPSKFEMAKSLLYKQCIMNLPIAYEHEEAKGLADTIIDYIEKAFN